MAIAVNVPIYGAIVAAKRFKVHVLVGLSISLLTYSLIIPFSRPIFSQRLSFERPFPKGLQHPSAAILDVHLPRVICPNQELPCALMWPTGADLINVNL